MAQDLVELQTQLDTFTAIYNHQRPHRGIGRVTPIERWNSTTKAVNPGIGLPGPGRRAVVTVGPDGCLQVSPWVIHIGVDQAGRPARILLDDTHAAVFIDGLLVRHLELDPTRRYQPSGRPQGRPRLP